MRSWGNPLHRKRHGGAVTDASLGVDPGGKRVGVAVGDDETGLASPVAVIPYRGVLPQPRRLCCEVARFDAASVVIGLPTDINGKKPRVPQESSPCAAIEEAGVMTSFQPEYLTTHEARERARLCGRPAEAAIDDLAALVLLEEFLAKPREDRRRDGHDATY